MEELSSSQPVDRPGCVTAYAILAWLGAAGYLLSALFLAVSGLGDPDTAVFAIGGAFCISLLAAIPVLTGIGLWRMTKWGWWLVVIINSFALASNGLYLLIGFLTALDNSSEAFGILCAGFVGIVITGIILYWFMTNRSLFFGTPKMEKVIGPDGEIVERPANQSSLDAASIVVIVGVIAIFCLIPVVTIFILTLLGPQIGNVFSRITVELGTTPMP